MANLVPKPPAGGARRGWTPWGEGGTFVRVAELSAEARDVLETPLLPGLAIPLAAIFA